MNNKIFTYIKQLRAKRIARQQAMDKIRKCNTIDKSVRYFNFYDVDSETFWFSLFLKTRTSCEQSDKQVAFFSNFGERENLKYAKGDIRIFFTGENLRSRFLQYGDNMLSDPTIDLALGFDYFEDKRYLRFPLWLQYMFRGDFGSPVNLCVYP